MGLKNCTHDGYLSLDEELWKAANLAEFPRATEDSGARKFGAAPLTDIDQNPSWLSTIVPS